MSDQSTPRTYRIHDEEMAFVEHMMRLRQISQQSEYVRMLLWLDATLHASPTLLEHAVRKRPKPTQMSLAFTPRLMNWALFRTMLDHYVNADTSQGALPPAWTLQLANTNVSTDKPTVQPPEICCESPRVAHIGFSIGCESCGMELSPMAAANICGWLSKCAAQRGNVELAREYERQMMNHRVALHQEATHQELRCMRRTHGDKYKTFDKEYPENPRAPEVVLEGAREEEVNGEDDDGLEQQWPFANVEFAMSEVCQALKTMGGRGQLHALAGLLKQDELHVDSALEMAQDRELVVEKGKNEWVLLDNGLKLALGREKEVGEQLARIDALAGPAPSSAPSTTTSTASAPMEVEEEKVDVDSAQVVVCASTTKPPKRARKAKETPAEQPKGELVQRCRNSGATKNVAHLVKASSRAEEEWESMCGKTLYPLSVPRPGYAVCPKCQAQQEEGGGALEESQLELVTDRTRVWDGVHDCAHTVGKFGDEKAVGGCILDGPKTKTPRWSPAPPHLRDCDWCKLYLGQGKKGNGASRKRTRRS